jgi:hypothetical protein
MGVVQDEVRKKGIAVEWTWTPDFYELKDGRRGSCGGELE